MLLPGRQLPPGRPSTTDRQHATRGGREPRSLCLPAQQGRDGARPLQASKWCRLVASSTHLTRDLCGVRATARVADSSRRVCVCFGWCAVSEWKRPMCASFMHVPREHACMCMCLVSTHCMRPWRSHGNMHANIYKRSHHGLVVHALARAFIACTPPHRIIIQELRMCQQARTDGEGSTDRRHGVQKIDERAASSA